MLPHRDVEYHYPLVFFDDLSMRLTESWHCKYISDAEQKSMPRYDFGSFKWVMLPLTGICSHFRKSFEMTGSMFCHPCLRDVVDRKSPANEESSSKHNSECSLFLRKARINWEKVCFLQLLLNFTQYLDLDRFTIHIKIELFPIFLQADVDRLYLKRCDGGRDRTNEYWGMCDTADQ